MASRQGKEVWSPVIVAQLMATIMLQNDRHTFESARNVAVKLLAYAESHPIEREAVSGEDGNPGTEAGELASHA